MHTPIRKYVSHKASLALLCLAVLMATSPCVFSQEHSAEGVQSAASAQPGQRDYRFEVISIRPTGPSGPDNGGSVQPYSPGSYREERIYPAALVMKAFNLKHAYQLEYPRWMLSTYFSVNATIPAGATKADLPIMIQHLLEDRFALKYHTRGGKCRAMIWWLRSPVQS